MKFILALIVILSTSVASHSQSPAQKAKLETKHGIRNIKLGTHKSKFKNLYKVTGPNMHVNILNCGESYQKRDENLMIGNVKASKIQYMFINNQLVGIYVYLKNSNNAFTDVVNSLKELYGKPNCAQRKQGAHMDYYSWDAQTFSISYESRIIKSQFDYEYEQRYDNVLRYESYNTFDLCQKVLNARDRAAKTQEKRNQEEIRKVL